MDFRLSGISPEPFRHLFARDEAALATLGVKRYVADDAKGFPCRVSIEHAAIGEEVLLLSYQHQPADSPYRASGPIFVRKSAVAAFDGINEIPAPIRACLLSVRAYDASDLIVDAEVIEGAQIESLIARFFCDERVATLHIHYARRGCFACRVDRMSQ